MAGCALRGIVFTLPDECGHMRPRTPLNTVTDQISRMQFQCTSLLRDWSALLQHQCADTQHTIRNNNRKSLHREKKNQMTLTKKQPKKLCK